MRFRQVVAAVATGVVLLVAGLPTAQAQTADAACAKITQACKDAGFSSGAAKTGAGLKQHCVQPLLDGKKAKKAKIALPTVDPALIAACNTGGSDKAAKPTEVSAAATVAPAQPVPLAAGAVAGPNIVMVLTDDMSMNLISTKNGLFEASMPNLAKMQAEGATFENYFVTNSLCCPSRSSILTGKFPHNSGVLTNKPPYGGFDVFVSQGNEPGAFSTILQKQSYRTALMGKYLNGYDPAKTGAPLGWSDWAGIDGGGYAGVNYIINQNGAVSHQTEYVTDFLSKQAQAHIAGAAKGPFFLEIATFVPHAPFPVADRYKDAFPDVAYDRTPAFGARPDANAPGWLRDVPALEKADITRIEKSFRKRVQGMKAIDDMIGEIRAQLVDLGIADNTYFIFTSDNGFHLGEYSMRSGKMTPYDTDINVPLIVAGPGIAAGRTISEFAMNIDFLPTFSELAGVAPPSEADGRSLVGLLHGTALTTDAPWRTSAFVEHHTEGLKANDPEDPDAPDTQIGQPPNYGALRTAEFLYVEYGADTKEIVYYDLASDPYALSNIVATLTPERLKALHEALVANATCKGADQCWQAQSLTP